MKNFILKACVCFTVGMFLVGCASVDPVSVTKFKQGLSIVQTESQSLLLEFNRFVRDLQLDRAATLPNLKESDVTPGLDVDSIIRWNTAIEAMSLYASSLETLVAPEGATNVEESVTSLGNRIIALTPSKDSTQSKGDELTKAIGHIGKLLTEADAKSKALQVARHADPWVRACLSQMGDMIGMDHESGGIRTTLWSNWTTRSDQYRKNFEKPGADKRQIASTYATAIEGRVTSDAALGSLRKSFLDLADLHTAVAQGRSADAGAIVSILREEVAYAKQLLKSAATRNPNGGT